MQIRGQAARRAAVDDEGLGLGQPAREEGVEHGVEDAMAAEEQLLVAGRRGRGEVAGERRAILRRQTAQKGGDGV